MFREIKKKKNEIDINAIKSLLLNNRRGVFAVNGDDNYPYAVPINYLYDEEDNKIYFHGARVGYKVESLKKCDKVCFTVYGNETFKEELWAPFMQSVVIFGRCHLLENNEKTMNILKRFAMKYYPSEQLVNEEIKKAGRAVQVFEIEIEHISGKEVHEK